MSAEAALTASAAQSIAPSLFPPRQTPTPAQIARAIEACLAVQRRAVSFGKRPFAAVLLGPDNETVLLTHQSVDQVNHAESSLARLAYLQYPKEFLWTCTLVSTWEPCAMCSGGFFLFWVLLILNL
jgi:tRNA(Arg) A34 adenosine deaminase TadA